MNINKPKYDTRNISGGKLNNGIKYIIINDSILEKSYASVSVNIGSYANPKEYNGLAHFLEHMLFMGSKKYPDENHFSKRVNEYGGYSNAYTTVNNTTYFFNTFDDGFEETIDIFSRFFIDPLFDNSSVDREINAVDSEHKKNIHSEFWKKYQLSLYLTNKDSDTNTFITGSLNSLKKDDIRTKMIEFYNKYYGPSNMSICIASSKPIETIKKLIDSTFGLILAKDVGNFDLIKPFYSENKNKTFHMKTDSDMYELNLIFEIPTVYSKDIFESCDFTIVKMILCNRSKNSLYFHLKNLGLITSFSVNIDDDGIFTIIIKMTKKGFESIEFINSLFMNSIKMILELDLNIYAKYFQKICDINWTYMEKINSEDLCNMFAENHINIDTVDVYSNNFNIRKIKSNDEYKKLLKEYLNPYNVIRLILSKKYKDDSDYLPIREYNAHYKKVDDFSNIKLDNIKFGWGATKNNYLTIKPLLLGDLDDYNVPELVGDKQWYGGCSKFGEPSVIMMLQLNNNMYYNSAKNYLLTSFACSILNTLVSTIMYKPIELGYSVNFSTNPLFSSININISGLNDPKKLSLFIHEFMAFLLDTKKIKKISSDMIENLILTFKKDYNNIKFFNPSQYSSYIINSKIVETEYDYNILLKELDSIVIDDIKNHIANILIDTVGTSIMYGNIDMNNTKVLFNKIQKECNLFSKSYDKLPKINLIKNLELTHPNPKENSSCYTYYYHIGKFNPKKIVLMNLCINILSNEFFDFLRTKHQLGYLVNMSSIKLRNDYYIKQVVQSDKDIKLVKDKIEEFNKMIPKIIEECDFKKHVETYKMELIEAEYSMMEKVSKYFPEILSREYMFNRNKKLLVKLQTMTKLILSDFAKININIKNRAHVIINGN